MSSIRRDGQAVQHPAAAKPIAPEPIVAILRTLRAGGHSAWWVGESLHACAKGRRPVSFEISTSLTPADCLRRHANAVPTRLEADTVMIPSAAGPVDVTSYRNGTEIEGDLAHRDFSVHAMAHDPIAGAWLDPHGGMEDARAGRLRAVGVATDRLEEDPLRAIRAARVCAEHGYTPDDQLLTAMRKAAPSLGRLPAMRIRWELSRLIRGDDVEAGMQWLQRSELAGWLFPNSRAQCTRRITELPSELAFRLAWLLRGTRSGGVLRRLGFGRVTSSRVQLLLAHHPIEDAARPGSEKSVRRLLRRLHADDLQGLMRMSECERADLEPDAAAAAQARSELLQDTIARVLAAEKSARQRPELALDGDAVMQALGCAPGPIVGRALDFLAGCVARDPDCNHPDALLSQLKSWAQHQEIQ